MRGITKNITPALALLGLWVASVHEARAGLIYDTGGPEFTGGSAISAGATTAGFFSLGAAATLTEVKFASLDQPGVSTTVDWFVYDDAGGTPGTVVAAGTAQPTQLSLGHSFGDFTYYDNDFSIAGPTLAAGNYFLALSDTADSSQIGGEFPRNWALNTPSGPNFLAQQIGTGPWKAFPYKGVSFQVFGDPATVSTPEPSTMISTGTAAVLALAGRWSRRRGKTD